MSSSNTCYFAQDTWGLDLCCLWQRSGPSRRSSNQDDWTFWNKCYMTQFQKGNQKRNNQTNKRTAKPTIKHQCKWDSQHRGPQFFYLRTLVRYRGTAYKDNDLWPHRTDQEVDWLDGIIYFLFLLFILHLSWSPVTEKKLLFSLQYCKLLYLSLMWSQSIILSVDLNAWKISLTYNATRQP